MKIDELISLVAGEPERAVAPTVWSTPADLLSKAAKPGGLSMTDFLSAPGRQAEQREVRYGHILGSSASEQTIDDWQSERPMAPLPADLRALVTRINGIHLWANKETGRSYTGLAPIEEWELARLKMYGSAAAPSLLDDRYVAISCHQDGAAFVVLDVKSGQYFLMDAAGPDATAPIAHNASELLDWIWRTRIAPKA